MDPISAVSIGQSSPGSGIQSGASVLPTSGRGSAPASTGLDTSNVLGSSQAMTNLQTAVTQLMQSAGGVSQNDKLMRLLLVALILMALLQQSESDGGSAPQPLANLSNGNGDRSQFVGIFTSSTTISIQQSSTTVIMGSNPGESGAGTGATADTGTGGRIDVAA